MKLNYKKFGESGKNIVILHGLFGMLDNWQIIGKQLAKKYQVYLIDQRNHGKSEHSLEFDYFAMADDLLAFLDEKQLDNIYLIGHSMGGKAAMQFACEHNDKVEKLVVVDIAPKNYPPKHQTIFDAFFAVDIEHISSRKEAENILSKYLTDKSVIQFLLKNLSRQKDKTYRWKCNLETIYHNYHNIIGNSLSQFDSFDGSTLFVKGGKSLRYIVLDDDISLIKHHFPKAKIETIANTGHWVHAEQPKAFLEMTVDFLAL
ncbi:MAG: alpha/beta fold hydrolase [Chitinophagales bacterium]